MLTPLLVRLALGPKPSGWIAMIVDQTTVRGTPTIMVGVRLAGRVLPVAFATYVYEKLRKSQNIMESSLLKLVAASLPLGCKPLFVMDRGYARVVDYALSKMSQPAWAAFCSPSALPTTSPFSSGSQKKQQLSAQTARYFARGLVTEHAEG